MTVADNTPSENEPQPTAEQAQVQPVNDEAARPQPELEEPQEPAPQEGEEEAAEDPRAAALERLAERRQQQSEEVLRQTREATVDPLAPKPEPVVEEPPEPRHRVKVRGEVRDLPLSEIIALAQKNDAADSYLEEAKTLLREAKDVARPQPAAQAQPEQRAEKVDRIGKAIETIQTGGDAAEARALLAEEVQELAHTAARSVVDEDRTAALSGRYDSDVTAGFNTAATEFKDLMADRHFARDVFDGFAYAQKQLVAAEIDKLSDDVRAVFAQAGITREALPNYSSQEINALYKDMALKGYALPPPSIVVKTIAQNFAEKRSTTAAAPTPEPQPKPSLDRTARKEAIIQPERTSIPRPQSGRTPPPVGERDRATSARNELRNARATGVPIRR